jgi:hypothetical protein
LQENPAEFCRHVFLFHSRLAPRTSSSDSGAAAKEIAEVEKQKAKTAPTVFPTLPDNPANFSEEKTEGKSQRIN